MQKLFLEANREVNVSYKPQRAKDAPIMTRRVREAPVAFPARVRPAEVLFTVHHVIITISLCACCLVYTLLVQLKYNFSY